MTAHARKIDRSTTFRDDGRGAITLTEREQQVLQFVADGFEDPQIAELLGLSRDTIKSHVTSVRGKLGARTRAAAACEAMRRGWIV